MERISLQKGKSFDLPFCLVRVTGLATARLSRLHAHGLCDRPPEGRNLLRKPPFSSPAPSCKQKIFRTKPDGPIRKILVRVTGLEPVRLGHTPLKRACLPIPAHSHFGRSIIISFEYPLVNIKIAFLHLFLRWLCENTCQAVKYVI